MLGEARREQRRTEAAEYAGHSAQVNVELVEILAVPFELGHQYAHARSIALPIARTAGSICASLDSTAPVIIAERRIVIGTPRGRITPPHSCTDG